MNGKTRLGLGDAAVAAGVSRTTLLRSIRSGEISATRHKNAFVIDASELARAFPQTRQDAPQDAPRRDLARAADATDGPGELRELRARLDAAEAAIRFRDETLADLRRRLDAEAEERRRLTLVLADQRTASRRSWWPWRRV